MVAIWRTEHSHGLLATGVACGAPCGGGGG